MKITKEIIFWLFLLLIILIGFWFFFDILQPSYYSYLAACNEEKFEETPAITLGSTTGKYNFTTQNYDVEIEVLTKDKTVLKHELVHANQIKRNTFWSMRCEKPVGKIITEMEAYAMQELPDWLFEKIYGLKIKDFQ